MEEKREADIFGANFLNVHNCCPEISRAAVTPEGVTRVVLTIIQNLLLSVLPAPSSCTSDNPVVSQTPF